MNKITQSTKICDRTLVSKKNKNITFVAREDKFMKTGPRKEFSDRAIKHFSNFGCDNIAYALWETSSWSNGIDYIYPTFDKEWNICKMTVGIFNSLTGEYDTCSYSKKELFDLVKGIRTKFPQKEFDEDAFEAYYRKFVEKFEKFEKYN